MPGFVSSQKLGDIALLRMDDERTLNAMSFAMADALRDALEKAAAESRAIVLTGAGRAFCSGANLSGGSDTDRGAIDLGASLRKSYNPLMLAIRDLGVPLVTAVNGPAAGIGTPLALAGDLVVAARESYFLQAFRHIGLVADGGSAYFLSRTAGRARAMEMMLLGDRVPAEQALAWGMVNRVVEADQLMATAMDLANRVATGPTHALVAMRTLCWGAFDQSFECQLAVEADLQTRMGQTRDFGEGIKAFREKRAPRFRGD